MRGYLQRRARPPVTCTVSPLWPTINRKKGWRLFSESEASSTRVCLERPEIKNSNYSYAAEGRTGRPTSARSTRARRSAAIVGVVLSSAGVCAVVKSACIRRLRRQPKQRACGVNGSAQNAPLTTFGQQCRRMSSGAPGPESSIAGGGGGEWR